MLPIPEIPWWCQRIPDGWNLVRNGSLFTEVDERGRDDLPVLSVSLVSGVEVRDFSEEFIQPQMSDYKQYKIAREGDIVFNKMRMWQGAVGTSPVDGLVSPDYTVLRPRRALASKFFELQFRTSAYMCEVDRFSHGITKDRNRIYWDQFKCLRSLDPPLEQQRKILDILDRKTAIIDALIEKKERMIELLAEKRAALVHRVVTKGLDPDVPMKDSGVPWIGEIPAHWEVERLKQISPRITVGVVVNPSIYVSSSGAIPFFYGANIQPGRFDVKNARRIDGDSSHLLKKSRLEAGDLVIVRVGDPGVAAAVPEELAGANCASVVIVRGSSDFDSKWLEHSMNSEIGKINVNLVAYGAAQKQFNVGHAVDFVFPVPPLREQLRIAAEMDEYSENHRRRIHKLRRQIDRLKEYRQALITQAVTGQLEIPAA